MKFKLIGENNFDTYPIETIFRNRGVHNLNEFINIDESCIIHHSLLVNIYEAVNCLLKHVKKGSKIFIQVDSDCDGFCSSAILINYLSNQFPDIQIEWRLHDGKQHGVIVEEVPDDVGLVIIPDAGTNQFDEQSKLKEKGIDVIVLDHHDSDKFSEYAIVVNNQLSPEYRNKHFSGAGIVYKFCKALDEKLNVSIADNYLDLVSVGNIGDMMDLRVLETRYYVKKGLEQINNPLIKEIINKQDYSMGGIVNIHNVAFYVVPLINAAVRFATLEEKTNMMKSFLEYEEEVYYKRNDTYETIHTSVARNLSNIRNRQNKPKDKSIPVIENYILKNNLIEDKVLVINVTEMLDKSLTGLVANQIAKKYRRPVLLLRTTKDGVLGGSARGFEEGEVKDFKDFLTQSDLFTFCEGHGNAFGVEIIEDNINNLKEYIKDNLKEEIEIDSYEVDFIINSENLTNSLVSKVGQYRDEWGSVLQEPRIAIVNTEFNRENIQLYGKKKNVLKMMCGGIEFVKYYFNQEKFDELFKDGENFYINILAKFKVNEWNGYKKPQVVIDKLDIEDVLFF